MNGKFSSKKDLPQVDPLLDYRVVKVADLREDEANARSHSDRNIEAIAKSLVRFGQQKPIVITPDNVVRAGNGTLRAAKRIGWPTLQCVVTTLKSIEELRAYAIADNRVGELSDFDDAVLAEQLAGLDAALLEAVGFDDAELAELTATMDQGAGPGTSPKRGLTGAQAPSVRVAFRFHIRGWCQLCALVR